MIYKFLKRSIDVFGAVVLLVIFSPVMFVAVIAIKLESKGPALAHLPRRVGKNGDLFRIFKFRSMIANAHKLLKEDPKFKKLHKQYQKSSYKLHDDPRVTRVGKFIRKYSIDEMPQFVNVLKGEMSIVGPRPYYQDELKKQTKIYPKTKKLVEEMQTVKPGITGYWQVSGRSEVHFDKRIEMDAFYARKQSILLDLLILLRTPWVMITGKGAV